MEVLALDLELELDVSSELELEDEKRLLFFFFLGMVPGKEKGKRTVFKTILTLMDKGLLWPFRIYHLSS